MSVVIEIKANKCINTPFVTYANHVYHDGRRYDRFSKLTAQIYAQNLWVPYLGYSIH